MKFEDAMKNMDKKNQGKKIGKKQNQRNNGKLASNKFKTCNVNNELIANKIVNEKSLAKWSTKIEKINISKLDDHSRGQLKGSLFNSYYTKV